VTDLEPRRPFDLDRRPVARPQVDLHKDRGLDLTPAELLARRANRRWMLILAGAAIVIFVCVMIADAFYSANEPNGPKISAPPGYKVVDDGYFAYVVPKTWSNNPDGTDSAGDVETSGPSGWVGENIHYYLSAVPTLYETSQPASLQAFGQPVPGAYTLSDGHSIDVKGASGAFEYDVARPDGFRAVAVDTWFARTDVELWLMVDAPQVVTDQLLASLTAGESG
jgi:hypothetical protein